MPLHRLLRGSRQLRSDRLGELTDEQLASLESLDSDSEDDDLSSQQDFEDYNDNRQSYQIEITNLEGNDIEIPQVNIPEMIELANELLGETPEDSDGSRTLSLRLPIMRNQRNLDLARAIIEEHERLQRQNDNGNVGLGVDGVAARRRGEDRPMWMKIVDSITVTLFPLVLLRLVKNILSISSFSLDVMEDTFEFIDYVQGYPTRFANVNSTGLVVSNSTMGFVNGTALETVQNNSTSLIMKFGQIILSEFPNLSDNFKIGLTLSTFYCYTTIFGLFMIISFGFLVLCLGFSIGKRWHSVERFLVSIFRDGENCI